MTMPPLPTGHTIGSGIFNGQKLFTADQMCAYGEACAAAERERAAEIADAHSQHNYSWASENADTYRAQANWAARIAAAIRATTPK